MFVWPGKVLLLLLESKSGADIGSSVSKARECAKIQFLCGGKVLFCDKVQAMGYPSSFLHGDCLRYSNRLWEHTLGMIHIHFTNYKVDLDMGGLKNSLVAQDMAFEVTRAPWSPEQQMERPRLTRRVLDTEDQAAFRLHAKMPRYIFFAADSENKWGHQRGYRIQITSFAGDHIPESSSMERAISWARYQLAVTKRKEEEPTSTSIYNQNDPWTPTVAFADFINNETITNEVTGTWLPG
uniref:Amine oxidase n=1 Tax=Malurus cyaneus samueli TaxID=2593467 RepID=A0A8C5TN35_9PASS